MRLFAPPFQFYDRINVHEGLTNVHEQLINAHERHSTTREEQTKDWERQQLGALRWSTNGEGKANGRFIVIQDANLLES
jgi:hypothetical protein